MRATVFMAFVLATSLGSLAGDAGTPIASLSMGENAWRDSPLQAIRGLTVGPIENELHPNRGYGSERCADAMRWSKDLGANWVSITPFGRVFDLQPSGVALDYESPFRTNQKAVRTAIRQAHAAGHRVMLVPHLWVEDGGWRGEIDPGDDDAWAKWADGYWRFVKVWAELARDAEVELFIAGVELRSWVTTARASSFVDILDKLRGIYPGLISYAANWDDVHDTVIWGKLDLIGVNAFFPLTEKQGASQRELFLGGRNVAATMKKVATRWKRPVMFTEFGYTTRVDPALKPWLWPEHLDDVVVDQRAQAAAYMALLAPMINEPWFAGAFVWRVFSDRFDSTQESEWGFSPEGKLAEQVLESAFAAEWGADGRASLARSPLFNLK